MESSQPDLLTPQRSVLSRGFAAAVLTAAVLGSIAGCSGGGPLGSLEVEPSTLELPYPSYADIELLWNPTTDLGPTEGRPTTFVHLLDDEGAMLRTFDHRLPASWRAGRQIKKRVRLYQSAVAERLEPGTYRLTAGLYRPEDGERWPLETAGEEVGSNEYVIARITVPESSPAPEFRFEGAWQEVESGTDRQILARRWLTDQGQILVDSLPGPGNVWLTLHIPDLEVEGARLVLEDDARVPAVRVFSPTAGTMTQVQGAGEHQFTVPITAEQAAAGPIDIVIDPNFYLILESTFERRALTLETLAWQAADG